MCQPVDTQDPASLLTESRESFEALRDCLKKKQESRIFGESGPEVPVEQRDKEVEHIELIFMNIADTLTVMDGTHLTRQSGSYLREAIISHIFWTSRHHVVPNDSHRDHVDKLLKRADVAITTTERFRQQYAHIYRAVFYGILPGLDELIDSAGKHSARYGASTVDIVPEARQQSTFQALICPSLVHQKNKQLVSLSIRMAHLLDMARTKKQNIGVVLADTILEAAESFQIALVASQVNASICISVDILLDHAVIVIGRLEKFVRSARLMQDSIPLIMMKFSIGATTAPHLMETLSLRRELTETKERIENIRIWFEKATLTPNSLSKTPSKMLQISQDITEERTILPCHLTFQNVIREFENDTKIIKFHGDVLRYPCRAVPCREGSYADVYKVTLPEHIEHVFDSPTSQKDKEIWSINEVAVKVIRFTKNNSENEVALRALREYQTWKSMNHRNILPLIGLWFGFSAEDSSPLPAFVSPWVEENHLQNHLVLNPELSRKERLQLLLDIADALAYMHDQKPCICHGDINSQNILVHQGRAFICDFGISHTHGSVHGLTTYPHGHWRFRAPEKLGCTSKSKPTPQSDMYSFGALFFQVMTGDVPWKSEAEGIRLIKRHALEPRPERMRKEDYIFFRYCCKIDPRLRATATIAISELKYLIGLKEEMVSLWSNFRELYNK